MELLANGAASAATSGGKDHIPVVKLFTPDAGASWLLSEIDPAAREIAFGLCDLGLGFPELGCVDLNEVRAVRGRLGLPIERDLFFEGRYPLTVYAEAARQAERITENSEALERVAEMLGYGEGVRR